MVLELSTDAGFTFDTVATNNNWPVPLTKMEKVRTTSIDIGTTEVVQSSSFARSTNMKIGERSGLNTPLRRQTDSEDDIYKYAPPSATNNGEHFQTNTTRTSEPIY